MGQSIKIGDTVTLLDEVGEGKVLGLYGDEVEVLVGVFARRFTLEELMLRDDRAAISLAQMPVKLKDVEIRPGPDTVAPPMRPAKVSPMEIDLHLHGLPPLPREATAHDKLLHQLSHAQSAILEARRRGDRRIVLIHGNGTGRLRHSLEQMLRKDASLRYYDASFQHFGQGALEVEILHRSK